MDTEVPPSRVPSESCQTAEKPACWDAARWELPSSSASFPSSEPTSIAVPSTMHPPEIRTFILRYWQLVDVRQCSNYDLYLVFHLTVSWLDFNFTIKNEVFFIQDMIFMRSKYFYQQYNFYVTKNKIKFPNGGFYLVLTNYIMEASILSWWTTLENRYHMRHGHFYFVMMN